MTDRVRWLAVLLVLPAVVWGGESAFASSAHTARSVLLSDSGRLHLTSHHGFTLNETGTATGTISGALYIHLHIVSTNRVTAEVNLYPRNGSITGNASASYRNRGASAAFSGTMNVSRGTGTYGHAHGTGLSFSGTISRANDAIQVYVRGRLSY